MEPGSFAGVFYCFFWRLSALFYFHVSFQARVLLLFFCIVLFSIAVVPIFFFPLAFGVTRTVLFAPGTLILVTRYFIGFPLLFIWGLIRFKLSVSQQCVRVLLVPFLIFVVL